MRPNIIVIITHDTGCHFGCYGASSVCTPSIDALAADGIRCTSLFATASICSPSRGSLFTGKYPERHGIMGTAGPDHRFKLTNPHEHLSHLLRRQGYQTALFGHQHETADVTTLGFDKTIQKISTPGRGGAVGVADEVAAFLSRRPREEHSPFFLQIGFIETHTPYLRYGSLPDTRRGIWVPPYVGGGHDDTALLQHIAEFQGSIRQVDQAVSIIMDAVRASGVEENTLVLFTVDHGPELPRGKFTGFDAGAHVAGILRWPGGRLAGGRTCDLLLNNTDILPTLLDLVDLPAPRDLDGISFARALRQPCDAPAEVRDEVFFSYFYDQTYSVRTRRYKFIRYFTRVSFNRSGFRQRGPAPACELFDLEADPGELCDVAQDPSYASIREEMSGRLWRHLERVNAPVLHGPVAFPPYRLAMEAYGRQHGRWAADLSDVLEKSGDGTTCTIETARYRLQREFTSTSVSQSLRLFDRVADPDAAANRAHDPAYAEAVAGMDAKLWTWLEQEQAPILNGLPSIPALDAALLEHRQWRESDGRRVPPRGGPR